LIFLRGDKGQPSSGSAIDHIGFSVADLDATMKEFEAAGVKIVTPARDVPGLFKLAFVEDPRGTKIEVVQDSEKRGLHHVHLRAPDPTATIAFFHEKFGGELAKLKDRIDGVKFTTEPRPLTLASGVIVTFAYLEGPAGAKVELVRR
jgi:catechol 2,3-dioxygenase-like lactoylglutathione lyase family enzyme